MTETQKQTTDYQLIEQTVHHYFNGMIHHTAESFTKAFHPTATMKWNDKEFTEVNAIKALSDYVNSNETVKTKASILGITVVNDVANAQLELEYETFYFIDFMNLVKINGEWKIVNKIYTQKTK